ncbi:hypothetical protein [Silanimonas sp.]|uniref:hypothetical protein n=1 Tax=Silanimonas sp. TaxID=1929290 RepID=UPI0022C11FB1|nr:hypothetical protein [Silanimonas sp.]MCZ8164896.1 hypothetical protein [Silanimonas sp.]
MKFALATLTAIAVQPLWLFVWLSVPSLLGGGSMPPLSDVAGIALLTALVATPFVLLIGLPSGLILQGAHRRGRWLAMIGFIAAALPASGGVLWGDDLSLHEPEALLPMLVLGSHGLAGALVFHAVLRGFERDAAGVHLAQVRRHRPGARQG